MRNFCLFIVSLILLTGLYFSSCAKVEDDETEPPAISDVRINKNDTLMYGNLVVRINDSLNENPNRMDTVIATKWMYIYARFTDKGGSLLSTFKVEINPEYKDKRGRESVKDSIMPVVRLGQMIFNQKDITVYRNRLVQIPDTITRTRKDGDKLVMDTLVLTQKIYDLKVAVIDKAGNGDSIMDYKVVLMNRKTLYDVRVGQE
ncbi:hypothetical protein [Dysgonomonas gadei]|uniref:NigD-like C-terminal beta sandwich domain-containing protein n=1 Tax=Dysgonomonas gadei ATCC BAA-286 TaxID=742766 RepID=F5J0G8_9BACT|nr:hypothetical protein [Dysgonomonas gadei]EGK00820.1 hypothetical protein HMPREF9455_02835 [Dysgonomonas gadei ATCC BAA-286]